MQNFWQDISLLKNIHNGVIGIMGGSFNPPHKGHLHISKFAIKKLNLDLLLWLVTTASPFKTANKLLPLERRLSLCTKLTANNYKIKTSTLEKNLNNNYTFNTIKKLVSILPKSTKLIWFMGEDILYSFDKFYKWQDLTKLVNIAILSRGGNNTFLSLNQRFPQVMNKYYKNNPKSLIESPAPSWSFLTIPKLDISSTIIREKSN